MKIDTDKLRQDIEAMAEGPHRDAAMSHLGAAEQHASVVQTWIEAGNEQAALAESRKRDEEARDEALRRAEQDAGEGGREPDRQG